MQVTPLALPIGEILLAAADQRAQRLAVADHNAAANGLDNSGSAPQRQLLVGRLAAGACHTAKAMLRQRDRDVLTLRSAIMLGQEQQPFCKPSGKSEKSRVLNDRAGPSEPLAKQHKHRQKQIRLGLYVRNEVI